MDRLEFKKLKYRKKEIPTGRFDNLKISSLKNTIFTDISEKLINGEVDRYFDFTKTDRQKHTGLGDNYIREVKEKRNSGIYVNVQENNEYLEIKYKIDNNNRVLYDQNLIEIEDNVNVTIFIYYNSENDLDNIGIEELNKINIAGFRNSLLSINIGKNSNVTLIKIQNLGDNDLTFETMKINMGEKSKCRYYDVNLGGKIGASSNNIYLLSEWADIEVYPLYFVDKNRRIDLEQNLIINGANSKAIVNAKGALKDKSFKIFRGNIYLNKGCKKTISRFADSDIMLSNTSRGMSIPTIFCDEDDVVGEHAASFEAVNKQKLFYLQNRGFDELSAKKMITMATFNPVFDLIEDVDVKNKLKKELMDRL